MTKYSPFGLRCGTSIGYFDEGLEDELYLSIGFFDHPERFEPSAHAYWRMRLPYLEFHDGLSKTEAYTPVAGRSSAPSAG